MKSNVYVLYHAGCTDGTGAKYAAWKKFGDDGATYIAVNYGQEPPAQLNAESEVYILDFSYPKDVLERLIERCKSVVVLDHHKTAEEALRGLKGCYFDMHKSGAVLAWEYFHPDKEMPSLLAHVQDRDLWQWKMADTKAVISGIVLEDGYMPRWDIVATKPTEFYKNLVSGEALVKRDEMSVKSKMKYVERLPFFINGEIVHAGVINSTELASELGNAIYESKDLAVQFAIVYSIGRDAEALLSLRSQGDFDVSNIAKAFGGGGHKNASGAKVPFAYLRRILDGHMSVHFDSEDKNWKVDE